MFSEDELLPISALQHLLFCERQCALIHLEQQWAENRFTVEGQHLHRKAHDEGGRREREVRVGRGLTVRSFRLGLLGKTDIVEFRPLDELARQKARSRETWPRRLAVGEWSILPVEYKRGKPKSGDSDRIQLCAQALCLEEMLHANIREGALFYGRTRRRTQVAFDDDLRNRTQVAAGRLHELIDSRRTPNARREPKCERCSLLTLCLPDVGGRAVSLAGRIDRAFSQHLSSTGPSTDAAANEGFGP